MQTKDFAPLHADRLGGIKTWIRLIVRLITLLLALTAINLLMPMVIKTESTVPMSAT